MKSEKCNQFVVRELLHTDDPNEPRVLGNYRTLKSAENCAHRQTGSTTIDMYYNGEWKRSVSRLRATAKETN